MHTAPSADGRKKYGSKAHIMMTIAKFKIKGRIADEADGIYAKRTQAKAQNKTEKTLINMLQFGISATLKRIKTTFAPLL